MLVSYDDSDNNCLTNIYILIIQYIIIITTTTTTTTATNALSLRYRILPYIYTLLYTASIDGTPGEYI